MRLKNKRHFEYSQSIAFYMPIMSAEKTKELIGSTFQCS